MHLLPCSRRAFLCSSALLLTGRAAGLVPAVSAGPLPTEPLTLDGDLARRMVDGLHAYLDRETAAAPEKRGELWKLDLKGTREGLEASLQPHRERLRKIIGLVDQQLP